MPIPTAGTENFLTFEAVATNVSTLLFPLAGAIPGLKGFYFDDDQRQIVTTFGFIFSFGSVLYCRSLGVELVHAPSWKVTMVSAFVLCLVYLVLLVYFKGKGFPEKSTLRNRALVTMVSFVLFVGFFVLLSYSFNDLGLLKFSRFTVGGRVYVLGSKGDEPTPSKAPIQVVLKGSKGFQLETATDHEGRYEFTVNLSQLFETDNLVAMDPTGRYKDSLYSLPGKIYGSLQHNFFLQPEESKR